MKEFFERLEKEINAELWFLADFSIKMNTVFGQESLHCN
jgi:hypothetical protein